MIKKAIVIVGFIGLISSLVTFSGFAQTSVDHSNDDIVQLNNLRISGISSPTLPSVVTAVNDLGGGCTKYESSDSVRPVPCSAIAVRQFSIRVTNETILLLKNRARAAFSDFEVGDHINVYGFRDMQTNAIDALIMRDLEKPAVSQYIQLNSVEVIKPASSFTLPATITVARTSIFPCYGYGALGTDLKKEIPCSSIMAPVGGQYAQYVINITTATTLVNRNRSSLALADIAVGDKLNIYGILKSDKMTLDALLVRDLSKPVTGNGGGDNTGTLSITTNSNLQASVGTYFSAAFKVSGGFSGAPYTISGVSAPEISGLRFSRNIPCPPKQMCTDVYTESPDTIYLTGTPAQSGTYALTISASDNAPIPYCAAKDPSIGPTVCPSPRQTSGSAQFVLMVAGSYPSATSSITLLSPTGGEQIPTGPNNFEITYLINNFNQLTLPSIKIELLQNGTILGNRCGGCQMFADPSNWNFSWQVGSYIDSAGVYRVAPAGSGYSIRITLFSNGQEVNHSESGPFTIVQQIVQPFTIRVLSPNGGEIWEMGKTYPVTWQFNPSWPNPNVIMGVDLYKGNQFIRGGSVGAGVTSSNFVVPTTLVPGNDYKIKVTESNNAQNFDFSDVPFTIVTIASTTTPKPDLYFSGIRAEQDSFVVTVCNKGGTISSSTGVTVSASIDGSQYPVPGRFYMSSDQVPYLSGSCGIVRYDYTSPNRSLTRGNTYNVAMAVDPYQEIVENDETNNNTTFTITVPALTPPPISTLSPVSGPIGTAVTISGSGFLPGTAVQFGFGYIPNVQISNGTTLTFSVPDALSPKCLFAGRLACALPSLLTTPGVYDVSVVNPDGTTIKVGFFTVTATNSITLKQTGDMLDSLRASLEKLSAIINGR